MDSKDAICAVVCRNQPSCVGFAKDPKTHWCVWFDSTKPDSKEIPCSAATETEFLKNRQADVSQNLWTAMEKVHVFDKAIGEALKVADQHSNSANKTFMGWWDVAGTNKSTGLDLKGEFSKAIDYYAGTIIDTTKMREQYVILEKAALALASAEALANPPFHSEKKNMTASGASEQVSKAAKGLEHPIEATPKLLRWKDFPNSQDTAWSKLHPDCPMGPPCFCDCKCRGPPPQNFVAPPLAAEAPCPPPPVLPNPYMFTPVSR